MSVTKIIIEIKGGQLQCVYSNTPISYILIDRDITANDPTTAGLPNVQAPSSADLMALPLSKLYENANTKEGRQLHKTLIEYGF